MSFVLVAVYALWTMGVVVPVLIVVLVLLPMAALIGISLATAHLTWRLIEEPARLHLRKLDPFRTKLRTTERQCQSNLGE